MTESVKRSSTSRSVSFALTLAVLLMFIVGATSVAFAKPLAQAVDGQALFTEKCTGCHTIGGGVLVGPDLQGVTELRTTEWLTSWISAPDKMLAAGDPTATELFNQFNQIPMPNLGLTPAQVSALITYLGSTTAGGAAPSGPAAAKLPAGDAVAGKAYFVGDKRFQNGGPHCIACHSVAGIGSLGGGNLGPDLTNSGFIKSDAAFAAFISAPTTQTMGSIWTKTPLTTQEQADLYAFLSKAVVQQREPSALLQIALLSIVGAAILIALAQWYWGKRLRGVRKPMLERAYAAKRK